MAGLVGGIGGVSAVFNSPSLQKSIGIVSENGQLTINPTTKVETISIKEDSAVIAAVKKVSPSVVSVIFTKDVQVMNPFWYFNQGQGTVQQEQGGGTGFVLTSDGLIATNRHVANVQGAKYEVLTQDGKKYEAKVMALDSISDFAILKIEAKNLTPVEFGDSEEMDIGQRLIAIGNALGEFQNSVTVGVLSGKERTITASDSSGNQTLDGLLQTDAAINEGNSGGPLLNLKGQVVGINTATASKGQAEGLGFAIDINSIKAAIESYKKSGKIVRPYLGVRYQSVDKKIAAYRGMSADKGVLVIGDQQNGASAVQKDSPADKAGIKEGDVILKINSEEITQGKSLIRILSRYNPGDEVNLKIMRGAEEKDIKVKLGEYPS